MFSLSMRILSPLVSFKISFLVSAFGIYVSSGVVGVAIVVAAVVSHYPSWKVSEVFETIAWCLPSVLEISQPQFLQVFLLPCSFFLQICLFRLVLPHILVLGCFCFTLIFVFAFWKFLLTHLQTHWFFPWLYLSTKEPIEGTGSFCYCVGFVVVVLVLFFIF